MERVIQADIIVIKRGHVSKKAFDTEQIHHTLTMPNNKEGL